MARYLIVNADDFGLSEGVSRGIIRAHREGILTSTTFMVNFPWAAEMAPLLQEAPDLGVGVHLNLTTGTPVLPLEQVPSLVSRAGRLSKSLLHIQFRIRPEDARREWSAQVEKAFRLLGRLPTHLDTHRYLQGFPALAQVMAEVARSYRIPAVRCLYPGSEVDQNMYARWHPASFLVPRVLRRSVAVLARSGVACPDAAMAGDFDLPGLLGKLDRVTDGVTELVTHPALVDERLRSLSSLQGQREVELAALTSPEARQKVAERGIQLVSFAHLARR